MERLKVDGIKLFKMKTVIIIVMSITIMLLVVFFSWGKIYSKILLKEGIELAKQGNISEAEPIYQKVIKLNPGNAKALRGLGSMRAMTGKWEQAEYYFQRAKETDGDYKSIRLLSAVYYETEQLEKIEEYIPELLKHKLDGENTLDIVLVYAINENDQELFEEALKDVPLEYIQAREHTSSNIALGNELFGLDGKDK
jgi:tetratricopeptide (TPR) repeat protein